MKRFVWILVFAILFFAALGNYFFYTNHSSNTLSQTRQELIAIASDAALSIDSQALQNVPLERGGEATAEYQVIYQKLLSIKRKDPFIKYIYILTTTDQEGLLKYMVDADPLPQVITAKSPTSLPGDTLNANSFPEMLNAYNGACAEKKITTDAWGTFISGYAPIYDATGKPIAILGVDTDATSLEAIQKGAKSRFLAVLFSAILFSLSFVTIIKKY